MRRWLALATSVVPTRRLALVAACTAPAWLLPGPAGAPLLPGIVATVALLAVVLVDLVRTAPARAIIVTREAPAELGLGDAATLAYVVRSEWPVALALDLVDRLPPALDGDGVRTMPIALAPVGTVRVAHALRGRVRGPVTLGPVALRLASPWGLLSRIAERDMADMVRVVPSVALLRRYRLLAVQRRLRDAGVRPVRRRGAGLAFDALREYVPGDDPRHLDWKATARRGVPHVRQYAVEQGQTMIVALDAGRLMTQVAGDRTRFEHAIAATLVLADVAMQSRDKVGLLLFDDEVRGFVPPGTGPSTLRRMRTLLAGAEARLVEPDYAAAFRVLAERQRTRALVVVLGDVIDPRASRAVLQRTRHAARHHLTVFLALRNDALVAAAQPADAGTPDDAFRGAAAEALLGARAQALHRMRAAGVQVLDAPPQAMAPALVNRYLAIKARGEL
jgi:uncharacterized protein (DUF58 family)